MRLELISFAASDGHPLDGLVYQPEQGARGLAALLVHGKTHNFYSGPGRILPPYLTEVGVSCLAMNRRGHDLGSVRTGRDAYGGCWETYADSQRDIAGGLAELRRRGFERAVMVGHSFGGITTAAYAADHPHELAALALLSAGTGGPDYLLQVSERGMLAGTRHAEVAALARRMAAGGRGRELIAVPAWWYAISPESWLDLERNVPVTAESVRRTTCPVLALRGTLEPREMYPAEEIAAAAGARATFALIEGADHFYTGVEASLGRVVQDWIAAIS